MAAFTISSLLSFFNDELKSINRGENHYKSDHIQAFSYSDGVVKGEVQASMKNKVYKVTIYLDESFAIQSTECECPRGALKCSHAAALFIHCIHNVSRTDVECQWRKKKKTEAKPKSASELFPVSKPYNPLSREPDNEDRAWLYNELSQYDKFTGVCWLLSPESQAQSQHLPVPIVHDILSSQDFFKIGAQEKKKWFEEKMQVSKEVILHVAQISSGQQSNEIWSQIRKGRLTSSNFGAVLQSKSVSRSLMKRLLEGSDLSGVKSIMWGIHHEEEAINNFTRVTGLKVNQTGIWLDATGILGASPDGLIGDNAVIEVKCPYSLRDEMIHQGLKKSTFFLMEFEGGLCLKKDHAYWHQVQGQLHLTNKELCYFVVWTKKDILILKVFKDPAWNNNLKTLRQFYYDHIFPAIIESH